MLISWPSEGNVLDRVYGASVEPEFKMKMWAFAEFSGISDNRDDITGFDEVAGLFQQQIGRAHV